MKSGNSLLFSRSSRSLGWTGPFPPVFSWLRDLLIVVLVGLFFAAAYVISPVIGVVLCTGLVVVVASLRKPIILCYLLISGIVFCSGMPRGGIIPYIIPNEAIMLFCTLTAVPYLVSRSRAVWSTPPPVAISQMVLIAGTVILPIIAYYFNGFTLAINDYIKLLAPAQYILLFLLFYLIPQNDLEKRRVIYFLILGSVFISSAGLLQAVSFGPVVNFLRQWYPSGHTAFATESLRVTSLLGVWNGLGTYLVVCLLLIRTQLSHAAGFISKLTLYLMAILNVACLLASGSYAGLIGLIIGLGIIEVYDRKGSKASIVFLGGLAAAAIPLSSFIAYRYSYQFSEQSLIPHSLLFRFEIWENIYWPLVQKYWVWGYYPNISNLTWNWPESQYFLLVLRSGIFSLLAHFTWVGLLLAWLYRFFRSKNEINRGLSLALFSSLIVLSIMGVTNSVFTYSGAVDYAWIMMGLIACKVGEPG